VETGAQLRVFEGHEGRVTKVTFSPDGKTLFTAAEDGSFRLWDVETGAVLRVVHLRPDAWLETGPGGEVIRMSEHGWKYLYGTREQPDALPLPVCPDLPEIVFDAAGQGEGRGQA
jgi:WD40 repeat protein